MKAPGNISLAWKRKGGYSGLIRNHRKIEDKFNLLKIESAAQRGDLYELGSAILPGKERLVYYVERQNIGTRLYVKVQLDPETERHLMFLSEQVSRNRPRIDQEMDDQQFQILKLLAYGDPPE